MPVYTSGAFLQQCFSVHPLSLSLKLVRVPTVLGVVCTNCRMKHRLTVEETVPSGVVLSAEEHNEIESLQVSCHSHFDDVRITMVDVVKDFVEFRCRPCRRAYAFHITQFETHQS